MILERHNPKPLYLQLSAIIRERIDSEEWKPHNAIPSENELSKTYGVSRMTARAVVSQFVREGLLYRVPGKGTYVAEPKITTSNLTYMGIREQLETMGYQTVTKVISVARTVCTGRALKALGLATGTEVYLLKRLRYIRETPLSLHDSYIPADRCEGLEDKDLVGEQLCVILDKEYGLKRKRVEETLESAVAGAGDAKLLEVKKGYPLLLLKDIIYNAEGIPFEYTEVSFRGDKIKIRFQYND